MPASFEVRQALLKTSKRSDNMVNDSGISKSGLTLKFSRVLYGLIALWVVGLFALSSAECATPGDDGTQKPGNIILFIGDGMGRVHRQAAQWRCAGRSGKLAMDSMAYHGWVRTGSADSRVTDSAAAGTAIASGIKTNNGLIGMNSEFKPVATIMEEAEKKGKKTGIVTTTPIAHATPAAFAAHVKHRSEMVDIASQMMDAGIDVLLGGGENAFLPASVTGCYPEPGKRADGRNLIKAATASGYPYVCNAEGLTALDAAKTRLLLGLFADEGMVRPHSPSLAQMVQVAISILSRGSSGFFLMVEAGQIDWASHENDAAHAISDTLELDAAVQTAMDFPGIKETTLVIVVADHETGGMSLCSKPSGLENEDGPFPMPDGGQFFVKWSTNRHTAQNVPITASGPMADRLQGEFENTHIYQVMHAAMH